MSVRNRKAEISDNREAMTNNALTAENIYQNARFKRKRNGIILLCCIVAAELVMAILFTLQIRTNDFQKRVSREHEIRTTGEIELPAGVYEGDTNFGLFEGTGEFAFNTGATYSGAWESDQIDGIGILKVPSEGVYEGAFIDGVKSGAGSFTWSDGSIYDGEWKKDMMHGEGVYTASDDVMYEGTFYKNDFWNGICTFENDTGEYQLTYKKGKIDNANITFADGTNYTGACDTKGIAGDGIMTFPNGDLYTGAFKDGAKSGKGVYSWKSGDQYDGNWDNDNMTGIGTYTYSDGSNADGEFEDNVFIKGAYHLENAFGTYEFTIEDGEATEVDMTLQNGTVYKGGMKDGKLNGEAQIKYSNGDTYSGSVTDGDKTGQGTYNWASGASYEGNWKDDKMNGKGTYMYPDKEDGYMLTGSFENGVPSGECQYYVSKTEYYKTDWADGKCVKIYE